MRPWVSEGKGRSPTAQLGAALGLERPVFSAARPQYRVDKEFSTWAPRPPEAEDGQSEGEEPDGNEGHVAAWVGQIRSRFSNVAGGEARHDRALHVLDILFLIWKAQSLAQRTVASQPAWPSAQRRPAVVRRLTTLPRRAEASLSEAGLLQGDLFRVLGLCSCGCGRFVITLPCGFFTPSAAI